MFGKQRTFTFKVSFIVFKAVTQNKKGVWGISPICPGSNPRDPTNLLFHKQAILWVSIRIKLDS